VGKGIEVPALVLPGQGGVDPAHHELGQENCDEIEIIKKEIAVDRGIGVHQVRIDRGQKVPKAFRYKEPVED